MLMISGIANYRLFRVSHGCWFLPRGKTLLPSNKRLSWTSVFSVTMTLQTFSTILLLRYYYLYCHRIVFNCLCRGQGGSSS